MLVWHWNASLRKNTNEHPEDPQPTSRWDRIFSSVFPHNISKTATARITKLDIEMSISPGNQFTSESKGQGHVAQKIVPAWAVALL